MVLSGLSFFCIHFSDRFFLSRATSLTQIGLYSLAYKIAFLVTFLVGEPFERVWNIKLYGYTTSSDWQRRFGRVAAYLFFALVLVAVVLSLFANELLSVMANPSYRSAALLVPILVFSYVFREVGDFFRNLLFINKRVHAVQCLSWPARYATSL